MDKKLLFLQSCTRKETSTSDLGYLTKWLFVNFEEITNEEYFNKIQEFIKIGFFDNNKIIQDILDFYNK